MIIAISKESYYYRIHIQETTDLDCLPQTHEGNTEQRCIYISLFQILQNIHHIRIAVRNDCASYIQVQEQGAGHLSMKDTVKDCRMKTYRR